MASVTTDNGANVRPSGGALSPAQVRAYAYAAGFRGSGLDTIVKITTPESGRIPTNRYAPGPQEDSRGLTQINLVAHPQYANVNLYDPLTNLKAAYAVSNHGTNFAPWTTYTSGKYLSAPSGAGGPLPALPAMGATSAATKASVPSVSSSSQTTTTTQPNPAIGALSSVLKGSQGLWDTGGKQSSGFGGSSVLAYMPSTITNTSTQVLGGAQSALQKVAGTSLSTHPALIQKGSQGYVNPIPGAAIGRTDMGVDANLPSGHPILAIGDSKVVVISPNWYRGQPYVLFQLTSGPKAGQYYYIAEAINPTVRPGQTVRAGQVVGTYNSGGTGLELGWGTPSPGRTLAQATTGYTEGQVTPAGASFRSFLGGL